jgi:hypothetical protein
MKFKSLLLSCFALLFCSHAFSQEYSDGKLSVSVAPLSLIDIFDGASYRLGAEAKIYSHWAIAVEAGGYLKYLPVAKMNPEGYVVKPCLKFYFTPEASGKYIAFEYQYKDQRYDVKDSLEVNDFRFEKQYQMKRKMNCFSLKYGQVEDLGEHFFIEWYAGIGIRYMNSRSSLTREEEDAILDGEENGSTMTKNLVRIIGDLVYPNFIVGMKIGLRIM